MTRTARRQQSKTMLPCPSTDRKPCAQHSDWSQRHKTCTTHRPRCENCRPASCTIHSGPCRSTAECPQDTARTSYRRCIRHSHSPRKMPSPQQAAFLSHTSDTARQLQNRIQHQRQHTRRKPSDPRSGSSPLDKTSTPRRSCCVSCRHSSCTGHTDLCRSMAECPEHTIGTCHLRYTRRSGNPRTSLAWQSAAPCRSRKARTPRQPDYSSQRDSCTPRSQSHPRTPTATSDPHDPQSASRQRAARRQTPRCNPSQTSSCCRGRRKYSRSLSG